MSCGSFKVLSLYIDKGARRVRVSHLHIVVELSAYRYVSLCTYSAFPLGTEKKGVSDMW